MTQKVSKIARSRRRGGPGHRRAWETISQILFNTGSRVLYDVKPAHDQVGASVLRAQCELLAW